MTTRTPPGPDVNYGLDTADFYTDADWQEARNAWLEWEDERLWDILRRIANIVTPVTPDTPSNLRAIAALVSEGLGIDVDELTFTNPTSDDPLERELLALVGADGYVIEETPDYGGWALVAVKTYENDEALARREWLPRDQWFTYEAKGETACVDVLQAAVEDMRGKVTQPVK